MWENESIYDRFRRISCMRREASGTTSLTSKVHGGEKKSLTRSNAPATFLVYRTKLFFDLHVSDHGLQRSWRCPNVSIKKTPTTEHVQKIKGSAIFVSFHPSLPQRRQIRHIVILIDNYKKPNFMSKDGPGRSSSESPDTHTRMCTIIPSSSRHENKLVRVMTWHHAYYLLIYIVDINVNIHFSRLPLPLQQFHSTTLQN